jgi:raffinose/stachyose/melibiose transport system permease protein
MKGSKFTIRGSVLVLAILWLLIAISPFYFMVQTGFKEQSEMFSGSVWLPPIHPTLANYASLITGKFFLFLTNSVFVVSLSVLITVSVSSLASYVFARIKFRLSSFLFTLVIAGLIIPIHITLIPIFTLTIKIGLYDTLWALIGPYVAFHIPISVLLLTEFMREIPKELEDSARIDGCGPLRLFGSIILPLSKPGLATVAIYNAVFMWNEFVFAYILTSSIDKRTLPLGLWEYQGQFYANIPGILALLTLSSLPLIVAYIIGQERLVKGIMAGALKG